MSEARVPLDQMPPGATAIVRELRAGSELVNRLASLGLTEGVGLVVRLNPRRGPLLVSVRDTRIALGRGEAAKILVEPDGP
jgi:ferrous iron transport protein A